MSFQQIIAGKVKLNGLGGIRRHMMERQRVKTNPNIDLSRSHLNYCIEELTPDGLIHRVNDRIKQLNLKKKPRSDAVGLEDIIVSASADFMLQLDPQTRNQYFTDALHFFQQHYGKENIMYCQCHMDESNPHIHIGVVPITSDGHLSAKRLFSPKTLEQLQTDFHVAVSSKYGLERGEYHPKKYLPLQQFKAKQAKLQVEKFTHDFDSAKTLQEKVKAANKSAHFVQSGFLFSSEDKEHIQIPTQQYLYLKNAAEEGAKAAVLVQSLKDDIQHLQHDVYQHKSNADFCSDEWKKLREDTTNYMAVPKKWRHIIDSDITLRQKQFSQYCHAVNRATVKVLINNNCNFNKTANIMQKHFTKIGVKDVKKFIHNVFIAARKQCKRHIKPDIPLPSWKPPKPEQSDLINPNENDKNVAPNLVNLSGDDINWDLINWNLLSELEKQEIETKQLFRDI